MSDLEKDAEICEGVRLLLSRVESHPEEFDGLGVDFAEKHGLHQGRWGVVISRYWQVLTEYERAIILTSIREANRNNMAATVLKTIFEGREKREQMEVSAIKSSGQRIAYQAQSPEFSLSQPTRNILGAQP